MERGFHNFSIKMRKEVIFLIFLLIISPVLAECLPGQIDINTATLKELQIIKGIGPAYSQQILDLRNIEKFTKIEDLRRVVGIEEARLNNIIINNPEKICFSMKEPTEGLEYQKNLDNNQEKNTTSEKININTATAKELEKLDGIGSSYAQRIIESRPFYSLDDLIKVTGIGPAILNRIKEQGLAYVEEQDTPEQELNQTSSEESSESKTIKLSKEEPKTENVIKLNKQQETEKTITGSVVYQSKTENIRKYAIYAFSILLVGVIFPIIKK
jgi:competence ComEA-like helix-hairpin-helix protein